MRQPSAVAAQALPARSGLPSARPRSPRLWLAHEVVFSAVLKAATQPSPRGGGPINQGRDAIMGTLATARAPALFLEET